MLPVRADPTSWIGAKLADRNGGPTARPHT